MYAGVCRCAHGKSLVSQGALDACDTAAKATLEVQMCQCVIRKMCEFVVKMCVFLQMIAFLRAQPGEWVSVKVSHLRAHS